LLEKALAAKNVKNLVIVADGELGHIPFEIFLLEPASQDEYDYKKLHYLLNDYNISYNYSATLFAATLKGQSSARNAQILACASHYPALDSLNLSKKRNPQVIKSRLSLSDLPAAQKEVEILGERYQGRFLRGEEVTETFFKKHASQYGVIHLAMHGIVHDRLPILSSLAFTENMDSVEDNFLQAYEIAHLKLNANLVVLSACETGYGKFEQGEGVLSLARSFMYAGVPSLVVSLWQVNDASTAIIMEAFYRNLSQGMTKDAALRQAKLDYIDQAEGLLAHPAFWSPFIQLGDKSSLKIAQKTAYIYWIGGLLISLCLVLGGRKLYAQRKKEKM
jgi:CHAT domain-containing protein